MTDNLATATKVASLKHSFSQCFSYLKTSGSSSHEAKWDGFDIHLNFNGQKGLPCLLQNNAQKRECWKNLKEKLQQTYKFESLRGEKFFLYWSSIITGIYFVDYANKKKFFINVEFAEQSFILAHAVFSGLLLP